MTNTDLNTERKLKSDLRRAKNRENVAQCKLDRLKIRFDEMYDEMVGCQEALVQREFECQRVEGQLEVAELEREKATDEAQMWRAQLFGRLEALDQTTQQLSEVELELQAAWGKVEQVTATHQASHQELRKRDQERLAFEVRIEDLQEAQKESQEKATDLLGALNGADSAIQSLQRSNDMYQREVDGLKSLGASLTEKLTQVTEANDTLKEDLYSTRDQLALQRAHSHNFLLEIERLKDELYETESQLIAHKLENDVRQIRVAGTQKSRHYNEEKYGDFPSSESVVILKEGRSLLSRASKKMTGWFQIAEATTTSKPEDKKALR